MFFKEQMGMFIWLLLFTMFVFSAQWSQVIKLSVNKYMEKERAAYQPLNILETAGWFPLLQDWPEIILATLMNEKEIAREKSCTEPLENSFPLALCFDSNDNMMRIKMHPKNWLAHPTCQTPLGENENSPETGRYKLHRQLVWKNRTG